MPCTKPISNKTNSEKKYSGHAISLLWFLFLSLVTVSLQAGENTSPTTSGALVVESVLGVVNQNLVTKTDLKDKITRKLYIMGVVPKNSLSFPKHGFLRELINEELLVQKAREEKFQAPPDVIDNNTDRFIEEVKRLFPNEKSYIDHAESRFGSLFDFKQKVRKWEQRDLLIRSFIGSRINISKEELREFIKERTEKNIPLVRYRLSQIFLKYPGDEQGNKKKEELAYNIVLKIQKGADFTEMASEFSEDEATRNRGGDLGFAEQGRFSETIENAVKKLDIGDVSMPVFTEKGIHILRLENKIMPRDLLYQKKYNEKRNALILELRENAHVKILEQNL